MYLQVRLPHGLPWEHSVPLNHSDWKRHALLYSSAGTKAPCRTVSQACQQHLYYPNTIFAGCSKACPNHISLRRCSSSQSEYPEKLAEYVPEENTSREHNGASPRPFVQAEARHYRIQ